MTRLGRFANALVDYRRHALVTMLVLTLVVGSGLGAVEQSTSLDQFQSDSLESDKLDYVDANFDTTGTNTTTAQVIVRGDNVLSRDALVAQLEYQEAIRENDTVRDTLVDDTPSMGVANVVATTAITEDYAENLSDRRTTLNTTNAALRDSLVTLRENPNASTRAAFEDVANNTTVALNETDYETFDTAAQQARTAQNESQLTAAYRLGSQGVLADDYDALQADAETLEDGLDPSLDTQLSTLRAMNESEVDDVLTDVLADDTNGRALRFMPSGYDPGSTESNATLVLVRMETESGVSAAGDAPEYVVDAELAMQAIADDYTDPDATDRDVEAGADDRDTGDLEPVDSLTFVVFGDGIVAEEVTASLTDSLGIVGPLAMLFVLAVLLIAYRDLLDVALGVFGVLVVLVWTFGAMGWLGIAFNQMFIMIPVLLIGLSIDFGIHLVMRYREETADNTPSGAMRIALTSLVVALLYVTATTAIGFLSNVASPIEPIRQLGAISAIGIVSAFLVFVILVPALKVELEEWLASRGIDRSNTAIGRSDGPVADLLAAGGTAARHAPGLIILMALLVSAGGVYGATTVDTSFNQQDFLAEDPADWMESLPDALAPGEYTGHASITYLNDHFVRTDSRVYVLVEGDVTDDDALERVQDAREDAADRGVTAEYSNGDAAITDPTSEMARVASQNETFNATFTAADTDGNGVPDQDLEAVYDGFYDAAPEDAEGVVHRTDDGDYEALLVTVTTDGGATESQITTQLGDVAADLDGDSLDAIATGQVVLNKLVQDDLFDTVVRGLVIALLVVLVLLAITYRRSEGSASLGVVTVLPVALTVTWILGTMAALDIPFTVVTGLITSLTIGLGVDYSIHVTERYVQELRATGAIDDAMRRTLTGTGGALFGSAVTTAGGFGVLTVAVLPFLQQFGFITAVTIGYSFVASVLVVPSLLVVWTRYLAPRDLYTPPLGDDTDDDPTHGGHPTGGDDGQPPGPGAGHPGGPSAGFLSGSDAHNSPGHSSGTPLGHPSNLPPGHTLNPPSGHPPNHPSTHPPGHPSPHGASPAHATAGTRNGGPGRDATGHAQSAAGEPPRQSTTDTPQRETAAGEPQPQSATTPPDRPESGTSEPPDGFVPARARHVATRTLDTPFVRPGDAVTVTVTLQNAPDRVVLQEAPTDLTVTDVTMGPEDAAIDAVLHEDAIYAAWEPQNDDTTVTLTYTVQVPDDATDDETFTLHGTLWTPHGNHPVHGHTELTVLSDLFQRVLAQGTVTDTDLEHAHTAITGDSLTEAELGRLYRTWLTAD